MSKTFLDELIRAGRAALITERGNRYEFQTPTGLPVIVRRSGKRAKVDIKERLALVFGAGPACFAIERFHEGECIFDESYLTIEEAAKAWQGPLVMEGEIEELQATWADGQAWCAEPKKRRAA